MLLYKLVNLFLIFLFTLSLSFSLICPSLTQCSAFPHSSLSNSSSLISHSFFFLLSFLFAFRLRRSYRHGFVVACRCGFRFCNRSNGWVSILWVCRRGFVGMGLPARVCGGCGLRWVRFGGHGFRGSMIKVFLLWAWGVRWIWVAGDEGVPA